MTAKGKINASKVQINDRIIVRDMDTQVEGRSAITCSHTKTGETVRVARVIGKIAVYTEGRRAQRWYRIETTEGSFEAAPIQTMWLAPEDAAGVKRARVEAEAENNDRDVAQAKAELETVAEEIKAADEAGILSTQTFQKLADIHDAVRICVRRSFSQPAMGRLALEHLSTIRAELAEAEKVQAADDEADTREWGMTDEELEEDDRRALTLHSQDGKVDNMNNESETTGKCPNCVVTVDGAACFACGETTLAADTEAVEAPAENHTGSTVVGLLEKVWARIRADHPELPEVVIITGSGLLGGSKWGHFRADGWKVQAEGAALRKHELFLAGEALAKGAAQVLQTMLHEGAHTLAKVRDLKDTSRQGRWHNQTFRRLAEEMGLEHKAASADSSHGFSFVTLTADTKAKYADLLAELDAEIKLTCHLPTWLGGSADQDEDGGGEKITGKAPKGEDDEKPKSGPLKATCSCEDPIIIRLSQKVLDLGVVRCDSCEELFTAA